MINLLYRELSALKPLHQLYPTILALMTYRKDSQQGRLACILQANHGHVHLGRPFEERMSVQSQHFLRDRATPWRLMGG